MPATNKTTPHKHAELIKAWADGAVIQTPIDGHWVDISGPCWHENSQYRIKPEPKKSVGYRRYLRHDSRGWDKPVVEVRWKGSIGDNGSDPDRLIKWIDTEWQYEEYED